jgi:hypothetical protein
LINDVVAVDSLADSSQSMEGTLNIDSTATTTKPRGSLYCYGGINRTQRKYNMLCSKNEKSPLESGSDSSKEYKEELEEEAMIEAK